MCRSVMGLDRRGGCETLPSWSRDKSPLTGRPVNTACTHVFRAIRNELRAKGSACMLELDAAANPRLLLVLLGMRSPKWLQSAIPCLPYHESFFFFFGAASPAARDAMRNLCLGW